jgi:hypothetical protein
MELLLEVLLGLRVWENFLACLLGAKWVDRFSAMAAGLIAPPTVAIY